MVGVSSRSYSAHQFAPSRATACAYSMASRYAAAECERPWSASAQVSGSTSSGPIGCPVLRSQ